MMRKFRMIGAVGVLVLAGSAAAALASPAQAADCRTVVHTTVANVKILNAAETADTNAEVKLTDKGVRVSLPDADAKAYVYFPVTVKLADVQDASYETRKFDTTTAGLPAYQLVLDFNGAAEGGFTTLVHEGYLNGGPVSATHTWDAFTGKWWSTRPIVGQPDRGTTRTLADIVKDNPDAVVQAYGINIGAGSAGSDVQWNKVRFRSAGVCERQDWKLPAATPTPTHAPTTPAAPPAPANPGAAGSLPVTGTSLPLIVGGGVALLVVGAGAMWLTRRRVRIEA